MAAHLERGSGSRAIHLAAGAGQGPTKLAAFDDALLTVGVANYNLIRLSSVIPPRSVLCVSPLSLKPPGEWGDRLYVVAAEWRTEESGTEAWAGIGWIQDPQLGRGLFVEHEGESEAKVRRDIEASLASMRRARGSVGERMTDTDMLTFGTTCIDEPVCALVVAVLDAEPWRPAQN